MKKGTKSLSLLLAGLLLCGALTACSGKSDSPLDQEDSGNKQTGKTTRVSDNQQTGITTVGGNDVDPDHVHEWSEWTVTKEATCAEEGISTRSCDCGATESMPVEKLDHTPGEWQVVTAATFDAPGKETLYCSVCGAELESREITVDAKGFYTADSVGYYWGYRTVGLKSTEVIFDFNNEVVYSCEDGEDILVYGGGYFLSEQDDVQYLKKYDGTVICSNESLGIYGFGLNGNYANYVSFLSDGYVFAFNVNETYAGVTYEVGILSVDGKWIVPLSADNPILSSGMTCSSTNFEEKLRYLEEGILLVPVNVTGYSYDYMLYSIEDNVVYHLAADGSASQLDYMITTAQFEDGVFYGIYQKNMYEIHSDGKVKVTNLFPSGTYNFGTHGFYVNEDGSYIVLSNNGWEMELRINGTLIKAFEDVDITNAVNLGDVWLIFIENSEGTRYYTYLKPDGEFLFEPIRTEATYILSEEGIGVSYDDDKVGQPNGIKYVIDREGNVLYESEKTNTSISVNNGVVCEIDKSSFGTVYFEKYTFLGQ